MKNRLPLKSGVELAPLVDIVFLLLAYMLINSSLARLPAIEIELPAAGASASAPERGIDLFIRTDGSVYLNRDPVSIAELGGRIDGLRNGGGGNERPIRIRADRAVRYERVVAVMDALHAAGHRSFQLITNPKTEPEGP